MDLEIDKKAKRYYRDVSFIKNIESEDTFRINEIRMLQRIAFKEGYKSGFKDGRSYSFKQKIRRWFNLPFI